MPVDRSRMLLYWLPPLAWAGGIFALSCISFEPRPPSYALEDKLIHGLLFAVLSLLLMRALAGDRGFSPLKAAAWAFLLTCLYGVLDEVHQAFTPLRTPDVRDWLADLLGAAAAFLSVRSGRRPPTPQDSR